MTQDVSDKLSRLQSGLSSFLDQDDEEQAAFDREIRRRRPVMYPDEAVPMDPQFDSDEPFFGINQAVIDLMDARREQQRLYMDAIRAYYVAQEQHAGPSNEGVITISAVDTTGTERGL